MPLWACDFVPNPPFWLSFARELSGTLPMGYRVLIALSLVDDKITHYMNEKCPVDDRIRQGWHQAVTYAELRTLA